jgi:hypothetical protein
VATELEKRLKHRDERKGVLVPLFEDYHREFAPSHWDKDDIEFLHDLMERVAQREKERGLEPVYSPSGLGGCMRQSFLNHHAKKLGIPRKLRKKVETHFYFEYGTWLHLKIQVTLYKFHKRGEIELLGTEIPLMGKRRDNGGTLDAAFRRDDAFGVDIKGWNGRDFARIAGGDCPLGTRIQLANYIILYNSGKPACKLTRGIVLVENKAGPITGYPAALCEYEIPMVADKALVRARLESLREHEENETIPKAECRSTVESNFKDCAFRDYCKKEVERNEARGRRDAARGDTAKLTIRVAKPNRSDRTRGNRKRRGSRTT